MKRQWFFIIYQEMKSIYEQIIKTLIHLDLKFFRLRHRDHNLNLLHNLLISLQNPKN